MSTVRPQSLSDHLRTVTGHAHQRLEDGLDLLAAPPSRDRFQRVLEGFYGFHLAWEPAIAAHADLSEEMAGRGRLALLRADLRNLGRTDEQIDALPACAAAGALAEDRRSALGSLYVMEGSTLGGQLIVRALATAPWKPPEGLSYFNPYGPAAGPRWRAFKAWLDESAPTEDWPNVAAGALTTFDTLRDWLTRSPETE